MIEGGSNAQPGLWATVLAAIAHKKSLGLSVILALGYLALFGYASGLFYRVQGAQFAGVRGFPHFEAHLDPLGLMPYLRAQLTTHWYFEMNLIQAFELAFIAALVVLNVALSALVWRLRGQPAQGVSSSLASLAPLLISNTACAACAGIPAGLSFLPASFAGGMLLMAQFYGITAILTIILLSLILIFSLDRANQLLAGEYQRETGYVGSYEQVASRE